MKVYKNLVIIYYSGTGNARRTAELIASRAIEKGVQAYVYSFDKFDESLLPPLEGDTLVGFCSATHGFNLPHNFLKLILRFSNFPQSDVFIVNTRAGMKLSKLFLPGLSGIAQIFPALVLWLKGYHVIAMQPVDLPSNWISLHPGLKPVVVDSVVLRWKKKTEHFTDKILSGERIYYPAFISLPFDLLVAPLAFGYYFIGRFILAKTFYANDKCNNCMLCINTCPTKSLIMKDGRPFWKVTCESCMHCMNFCPERAIDTAHNWVIPLIWVTVAFVNPWIAGNVLKVLKDNASFLSGIAPLMLTLIRWMTMFLLFVGTYFVVHYLMHFTFFRKLRRYTSITSFSFWRRYKIPSNRRG